MPLFRLLLLVIVIVVVFALVTRFRDRARPDRNGPPVPVADLPQQVRQSIDHALTSGRRAQAIKVYRDATAAPLSQAAAAVTDRARAIGR